MNDKDTIRRDQFCQIKSEIRGSSDYLVVGIDVAKDKHHAFMGTATGNSLLRTWYLKMIWKAFVNYRSVVRRSELKMR